METRVEQGLVDSGDPLALALVEQGASTFKLTPVSEWKYSICEVIFFIGHVDQPEERSLKVQEGYMLSMPDWIDNDVEKMGFHFDWYRWKTVEEGIKIPRDSYGHGLYKTIDELRKGYGIRSV